MRISDWSSDVCSSDLFADRRGLSGEIRFAEPPERATGEMPAAERGTPRQEREAPQKIGRGEESAAGDGPRLTGRLDRFRPQTCRDPRQGDTTHHRLVTRLALPPRGAPPTGTTDHR